MARWVGGQEGGKGECVGGCVLPWRREAASAGRVPAVCAGCQTTPNDALPISGSFCRLAGRHAPCPTPRVRSPFTSSAAAASSCWFCRTVLGTNDAHLAPEHEGQQDLVQAVDHDLQVQVQVQDEGGEGAEEAGGQQHPGSKRRAESMT